LAVALAVVIGACSGSAADEGRRDPPPQRIRDANDALRCLGRMHATPAERDAACRRIRTLP
jgi:hypothetical protein